MVPPSFHVGSRCAHVTKPCEFTRFLLRSALVPCWFQVCPPRETIRIHMVPAWFRPGSMLVPCVPTSRNLVNSQGSCLVPPWFHVGSRCAHPTKPVVVVVVVVVVVAAAAVGFDRLPLGRVLLCISSELIYKAALSWGRPSLGIRGGSLPWMRGEGARAAARCSKSQALPCCALPCYPLLS